LHKKRRNIRQFSVIKPLDFRHKIKKDAKRIILLKVLPLVLPFDFMEKNKRHTIFSFPSKIKASQGFLFN